MQKSLVTALPLLAALATPVSAWGQANPREGRVCNIEDVGLNGETVITPLACQILVVGNLQSAASENVENIIQVETEDGQRLENALRNTPGLQQFRRSDARSANPTSQGVTLRGLGGNASSRALLFLDDVPQADPFGGWVGWPGYDALNLASIRVRRGSGQVASGPGGLAGIIELDSLQNKKITAIEASYGSWNSIETKASIGRSIGDGYVSASASFGRSDGFAPIRESQRGLVDRPAPYEQAGLALRAVVPLSDEIDLQANMRGYLDNRDRGFDFSNNENSGADASLRIVDNGGDWRWSALGYMQLRDFSTRFGSVAADRDSVRLVLDQFSVPSTGLGTRFELRPPVGEAWELRLGGDWRRTIGETRENFFFTGPTPQRNRNAGGRTDTYGGFAEASWDSNGESYGGLIFTAGGRIDRWQIANGFRREINLADGSIRSDDLFADRSGTEWSGRLGLAWIKESPFTTNDEIKLRASVYKSWRLPTLNELYRPFRVGADATAANELLSPERVKGGEIGFDYGVSDDFVLSLTGFWNRLDDAIANVTLGQGPGLFPGVGFVSGAGVFRQRQNMDAINSRGIEVDATYDLAYTLGMNSGYEAFELRVGYSYVDAEVMADGAAVALDGLRPAQVPKHTATFLLAYDDRPGLKAGARLRYTGNQFEDDGNTRRLDDAVTVDGWLGHTLDAAEHWQIELRGENIFDAEVQAGLSSSGIVERSYPRTIWLGLRYKIQ